MSFSEEKFKYFLAVQVEPLKTHTKNPAQLVVELLLISESSQTTVFVLFLLLTPSFKN